MNRFILLSFIFLAVTTLSESQSNIQQAIDAFVQVPALENASVGISVIDVASGKQIEGLNATQSIIPASSLKVIVTSIALDELGGDYTFKTELQYDGNIDAEGTLHGNLIIKGYGDPTLGSHHFPAADDLETVLANWVAAIKKQGIKKIDGQIIGDASYFERQVNASTWLWEDLGNYYASGIWGLNIQENLYFLTFRQNPKLGGKPEIIEIEPHVPNLILMNEVKSAEKGSGDNAYIYGSPWSYTRFVRGTIPIGGDRFTVKGAIPDPPFFAAHLLMNELEKNGIATRKMATSLFELEREGTALLGTPKVFYTHKSPSLQQIVQEANHKSVNLYCEALLKTIGKEKKGIGSRTAGIEYIYDYWKNKGMNLNGFYLEDGSGLSPRNGVGAYHLAKMMQLVAKDQPLFDAFYPTLPAAGKSGTLKYMFKGTPAIGKLRAKSGGMTRVRSYTGFAKDSKGRLLAFCIMANNFSGKSSAIRQEMQKFMVALCR